MPTNGQAVKIAHYTRSKFNSLTNKDSATIYYVEESDGKIKQYIGNTPVVSDITKDEVVRATTENKNILGTTEEVFNVSEKKVWFDKGALFFGTAADAGLVTRGISGTNASGNTKDHLYINYDGNNTLSRQLVLGAGSVGTSRGNGIYDYSAVRGDAFIAYLNDVTSNIQTTPGPKGDPGEKGDPGQAATVSVGTTTTSASGGNASVTQSGDAQNRTFNFVIPRGPQGEQGEKGTASLNSIDVRGDDTPGSQWDLIPANMDNRSITSYFSQFPESDGMGTSWKGLLNIKGWSGATYASWQLIGPASTTGTDEGLFYRTGNSTSGWSTPRRIYHSGNLGNATTSVNGLMSSADKTKLNGIATNATANSGTVTNVSAGTTQVSGLTLSVATGSTTPVITTSIANQANFRTAIGAGTSNLTIGTTSSTAKAGDYHPTWSQVTSKPSFATVATSGSYNDLSNKPTVPGIPSVMTTTEGNTGTATTQRTINAKNLKDIILTHSKQFMGIWQPNTNATINISNTYGPGGIILSSTNAPANQNFSVTSANNTNIPVGSSIYLMNRTAARTIRFTIAVPNSIFNPNDGGSIGSFYREIPPGKTALFLKTATLSWYNIMLD